MENTSTGRMRGYIDWRLLGPQLLILAGIPFVQYWLGRSFDPGLNRFFAEPFTEQETLWARLHFFLPLGAVLMVGAVFLILTNRLVEDRARRQATRAWGIFASFVALFPCYITSVALNLPHVID